MKSEIDGLLYCENCRVLLVYDRSTEDNHIIYKCRHCGQEVKSPWEVTPDPEVLKRMERAKSRPAKPVQISLF